MRTLTTAAAIAVLCAPPLRASAEDQLTAEAGPVQITFVPISGTFTLWIDQEVFLDDARLYHVPPGGAPEEHFVEKPIVESADAGGTHTLNFTLYDEARNEYPFRVAWTDQPRTLTLGAEGAGAAPIRMEAAVSAPPEAVPGRNGFVHSDDLTPLIQAALGAAATNRCNGLYDPANDSAVTFVTNAVRMGRRNDRWTIAATVSPHPLKIRFDAEVFRKTLVIADFTPIDPVASPPPPPGWTGRNLDADAVGRNTTWVEKTLMPYGLDPKPIPADSAPPEAADLVAVWGNTHSRFLLHGVSGWSNPGVFSPRPDRLSGEEVRAWASLMGLTGQCITLGGRLDDLPEERVEILRRILPPAPARPVDIPTPGRAMILDLVIEKGNDITHVIGLYNRHQRLLPGLLDPVNVGLDASRPHHVFDFWERRYLGRVQGIIKTEIPAESCRVLVIREANDVPQWVATSRHVAQGWHDLDIADWNAATHTMNGASTVVAGDPYTVWIGLPEGTWTAGGAEAKTEDGTSLKAKAAVEGMLASIAFTSPKSGPVRWALKLGR